MASNYAEVEVENVNKNSSPSNLKITDLRVATVVKPGPSPCTIIRIDTNQGVYGLGEVRDGSSPTYALMLKSRILGENSLDIDRFFRKIKQFGGPARQAAGVCSIEIALWDIAGKVYNVPIYQMLWAESSAIASSFMQTQPSPRIPRCTLSGKRTAGKSWDSRAPLL